MKTKTEFKHSLFFALSMLASPLSYASADFTVPAQATVREVPSTKELFFNSDGLPAPQYAGKRVPTWDCLYHGHVLKPGGEVLRYDRGTGMHWYSICYEANGHGVISPFVN